MMTKANTLDNLIKSVDIHYNQTTLTKSDVSIADAYIVNFVDDGGFAVLGANTRVDEIVAVSEYGSISLEEIDSAYTNLSRSVKAFYCDDGNIITNYYCKEDDDYYSAGQFLFPILVYNGLDSDGRIGVAPCGNDSGSGFCTVLPMLSTKWSQGKYHTSGVYNKYCKKGSNYVYAGCSTTALAQIIAYNHFPKIICGIEMDYQNMTVRPVASDLRTEYGEQVSLLFGDIFNNVVTLSGGEGTLITPEQIKKRMQEYGYAHVRKISSSKLTTDMLFDITKMLKQNKPVFFQLLLEHFLDIHGLLMGQGIYIIITFFFCISISVGEGSQMVIFRLLV